MKKKSRAKERIFSFRNENQAWDPKEPETRKCGNYITLRSKKEKAFVYSQSLTGQRQISGNILNTKKNWYRSIIFCKRTPKWSREMEISIMVDDDRLKFKDQVRRIEYKSVRFRTLWMLSINWRSGIKSLNTWWDHWRDIKCGFFRKEQPELLIMKQQEAWKEERERGISKMIGLLKILLLAVV